MEKNIYLKTLKLFGSKGVRFTTEDLAKELGTSKRTLYSCFSSKDEIIEKTIDYVFSEIINSDTKILTNNQVALEEKIKLYLENMPDVYNLGSIFRHMDDFQRYYPNMWEKVNNYINNLWDPIIQLIDQGIESGELEEINTAILKVMLNETLKKLIDFEFLGKNQVSFESGIKAMSDIVLYGLIKRKGE